MTTAIQIELFPGSKTPTTGLKSIEKPSRFHVLRSREIRDAADNMPALQAIKVLEQPIPAPKYPTAGRNSGRVLAAVILGVAGVGLAAVCAAATIDFGVQSAGALMGTLAASADAVALVVPTAACALWRARRRLLTVAAWIIWAATSSITIINLSGWVGAHTDLFLGSRELASTERTLVLDRLGRLRAERATITETRPAGTILLAIRNATKANLENERAALILAKRRDGLDRELAEIEPKIAGLPIVSMIDPSASVLADVLRLPGVDLRRVRLFLLLGLPLCGGLLIAMALAIGAPKLAVERAP